uniref:carbohydrate ABC transporter permease n=1 Tax=Enterocloster clostridioformis TaxID=1531 RepID=UPI0025A4DF87|nr:carbohydrate ABC transporter permease [Enterocloster clostridioformis]
MVMKKRSRVMRTTATYGILIIALLLTIFPIYWMIKSSLTLNEEMYVARPPLFSNVITFDHYIDLIYNTSFMHNVWNSFVIAAITTIICLAIGILGSYAMTRLKYPGRSFFRNSIIISYLMPTAVLFVLMYVFVSSLGFYDNKYALLIIYPTFVVPYCCYMLISYFKAIPYALEEAALIDGCNRLQTLWYIIMPIALPGIAVVATFAFTMAWNEYLYAMIMTTSNVQKTATVAISGFKYADSAIWGRIMSASVVCSLPVTLLYIAAQSMLISGKYEGSVK